MDILPNLLLRHGEQSEDLIKTSDNILSLRIRLCNSNRNDTTTQRHHTENKQHHDTKTRTGSHHILVTDTEARHHHLHNRTATLDHDNMTLTDSPEMRLLTPKRLDQNLENTVIHTTDSMKETFLNWREVPVITNKIII